MVEVSRGDIIALGNMIDLLKERVGYLDREIFEIKNRIYKHENSIDEHREGQRIRI